MNPSNYSTAKQEHALPERGQDDTESKGKSKKKGSKYRTGKWTEEETKFASQIIRCFGLGILKLPQSKTLRTHLSAELDCDPMRITKKFPGTALLMKEVSDDSKPEPPQSVAQNALLKLNSLQQAFRDRLENDRLRQNSRPSVFSLLDDHEDKHKSRPSTISSQPASADIGLPKVHANSNNMHHAPPQAIQGSIPTQPASQLNDVVAKGQSLGVLLEAATPGSQLAAVLANPLALAELWKIQDEQEEQLRQQRAKLMRLGSTGYAPYGRSVTPESNNANMGKTPVSAPQVVLAMNHPGSLFLNNSFSALPSAPTVAHSSSAPNLHNIANYFTSRPAPIPAAPIAQHPPGHGTAQVVNNGSSAPAAPLTQHPFLLNLMNNHPANAPSPMVLNPATTTAAPVPPTMLHAPANQNPAFPGWLAGLISNFRAA